MINKIKSELSNKLSGKLLIIGLSIILLVSFLSLIDYYDFSGAVGFLFGVICFNSIWAAYLYVGERDGWLVYKRVGG